jgi:acyl-CoA synthetase (AMP-forming)/AMP-acid ligase II
MSIKTVIAKTYAAAKFKKDKKWINNGVQAQLNTFKKLIETLATTQFGYEHGISATDTYAAFIEKVPVLDYEGLKPYFDRIANGESNVCWPAQPIYLAKTSGTTSGAKYIPITKASIGNHIDGAKSALLNYIHKTGNAAFLNGNLIFLSGSPVLEKKSGIPLGRLSGIVNHHIPSYLKRKQLPSWETNCVEDWEQKVKLIAQETINKDMTLIGGIPPWVQMYFDILHEMSDGKKIAEIFKNLSLFVYGGVNFEPYRQKIENSIGKSIDTIELFPASEGFYAYQDSFPSEGLLLMLDEGIFYEFIPVETYFDEKPIRISIADVKLDVNYALVINSNAGLWGYSIGDTVKFVSLNPFRVVVSGRIKHFISAFGEHVIGEEVEHALLSIAQQEQISIAEFTVAPQVNPESGLPYHEWLIAFDSLPSDMVSFSLKVDNALQQKNIYYKDLISGAVLRPLVITPLQADAFIQYMKSQGKLGGQNKVPRLSNDRKIADALREFKLKN